MNLKVYCFGKVSKVDTKTRVSTPRDLFHGTSSATGEFRGDIDDEEIFQSRVFDGKDVSPSQKPPSFRTLQP